MIEIERKFLVTSEDFKKQAFAKHEIAQGYLNSNPDRTVRIRIKGESGFLTIKGKNNASGVTRFEWETEIALMEAKPLLALCEKGIILKTRYEIRVGKHVFEVDVFHSDNDGLIIAEIELSSEEELFEKPNWLGKEVTNDNRFYNSYISQKPFKEW
ncbi:CYTH domain-containing protein [Flavobacterium luteum]|uniref:CYTH domain-containing protein n=1 Tax=Flavobacterium luteum TaxID=2026654 RepID=A0A7J5AF14_9FLAO|nr:CYTH domain-containing protein [Flavobacterium luteum]KAB1156038.1 CYTH domain-containing protein [Flavobacterium luteum]